MSLYGTKYGRYSDFRYETEGKAVMFDIDGFQKYNDLKVEMTEKTKLFIEYLRHEENMTYAKISTIAKISFQSVSDLKLGYKLALKLCVRFRDLYPFHWRRFHDYYGYKLNIKDIRYARR